jgi:hypothetical protein
MVERLKLRGVGLVVTIAVAALGWLPPVGLAAEARGGSVAAGGDATVSPEQSAEWLIQAIRREGALAGDPLTDDEVRMLRTSVPSLLAGGGDREQFARLNNKVVRLARSAMQRAKAAGAPTVEARPRLRIPSDWFRHYMVIFTSNLDWILSAMLQNAMMANPLADETTPWESR